MPTISAPGSGRRARSDAGAGTRIRLVDPRGATLRHARKSDEEYIRDRAGVDDLIHFARSLDERLPGRVAGAHALAADRSVNGERALLNDHDCTPWMRVPAGGAAGEDRDLRHDDIRARLKRDGPNRQV